MWDEFDSLDQYKEFTKQWLIQAKRVLKKIFPLMGNRIFSKHIHSWKYNARIRVFGLSMILFGQN